MERTISLMPFLRSSNAENCCYQRLLKLDKTNYHRPTIINARHKRVLMTFGCKVSPYDKSFFDWLEKVRFEDVLRCYRYHRSPGQFERCDVIETALLLLDF